MAAHAGPKFKFEYTAGGTAAAKRDTLTGGGQLVIANGHYMQVAMSVLCTSAGGADFYYPQHHLEYIFLDVFDWPDAAKQRNFLWVLLPVKVARYLCAANGHLRWESFNGCDELLVEHLRDVRQHLTPADCAFTAADMISFAVISPPPSMFDRVVASSFDAADGRWSNAVDFKSLVSGGYVLADRNDADGAFQANIEILIESAKDGLSSKSAAVQSSTVVAFVKDTAPGSRALRHYVPWDNTQADMVRRAKGTVSERFIPLLINAIDGGRDGGFPDLKLAFQLHALAWRLWSAPRCSQRARNFLPRLIRLSAVLFAI